MTEEISSLREDHGLQFPYAILFACCFHPHRVQKSVAGASRRMQSKLGQLVVCQDSSSFYRTFVCSCGSTLSLQRVQRHHMKPTQSHKWLLFVHPAAAAASFHKLLQLQMCEEHVGEALEFLSNGFKKKNTQIGTDGPPQR